MSLIMGSDTDRLTAIRIDASLRAASPHRDQDRKTAVHDLIEINHFKLMNGTEGPFHLILANIENRLVFDVRDEQDKKLIAFGLSMTPFQRIVKNYQDICASYDQAVWNGSPSQIETIDMARRGIHNEASEILRERLKGKVEMDMDTARRLFTLVYAVLQGA
jgi:uncharacterized protein (UPF0262 family)